MTASGSAWFGSTTTTATTTDYNPYQYGGSATYDLSKIYGNFGLQQGMFNPPKEIDMKGNGKEFLVFAKGGTAPVKACESEAEALEEASALADKNDETYFIYKAIKRVSPVRTDLEVTDL